MIPKLYARFWLWRNGYCRHGVKWQATPVLIWYSKSLSCKDCGLELISREDARARRETEKKQRMLEAL